MLHVWLIPVVLILEAVLCIFYMLVKAKGGNGMRTQGRTVLDQPSEEDENPPPG